MAQGVRRALAAAALLLAGTAPASVPPDMAARLGASLSPLGGERAGNAAGTIPAWEGAPAPPPDWQPGSRYTDPYAGEKPLLTIDQAKAAAYAAQLSPGQQALLQRYPGSYRLPVYPGHRSYAAPEAFYAGTRRNASRAFLEKPELPPSQAVAGIPFPFPGSGAEAVWNERLRWRGPGREGSTIEASVSEDGTVSLVRLAEQARFDAIDAPPYRKFGTVLAYSAMAVFEPAKLAGALRLVYDTLKPPPMAWQRSPGQRFITASGSAGGDTPVLGANGLLNEDQIEGFDGAPDRYDWTLDGKRELYVPYNAYRLHDAGYSYAALLGPHHLNPDAARYELHRVWVLQARCRPDQSCLWPRRTLYLDEDSWQVLLAESYDRNDRLALLQEMHWLTAWDQPAPLPVAQVVYDLASGRYLVMGLNNQAPETRFIRPDQDSLAPGEMSSWARHIGAVAPRD
jgi:hypothetical protein